MKNAKNRCSIADIRGSIDSDISVYGWVHGVRLHSKVAFCDLRDSTGRIQVVIDGSLLEEVKKVPIESAVCISGTAVRRQERLANPNQPLGDVELVAKELQVVSLAEPLPFPIDGDTAAIDEAIRMKYRYLDLRSERMQHNIRSRHEAILFLRNYYSEQGFIEVETPILTKGTPEGAREFIVPSRIHKGSFYVLPQSPQQYKQLLMVGGIGKYYQVARCFRDEDQRQDRQPEFTQFDLEMSFVNEEDIMKVVEKSMIAFVSKVFPGKKISAHIGF